MAREPRNRRNTAVIAVIFLLFVFGAIGVGALLGGFGGDKTVGEVLADAGVTEGSGAAGGGSGGAGGPAGIASPGGTFEPGFLPASMSSRLREASAWVVAAALPTDSNGVSPALDNCPPVAAVLATIAEASAGASINDIVVALATLDGGPSAGDGSPLAQRIRIALLATGANDDCQSTAIAVRQALDLAKLAAAEAPVVTAATDVTPRDTTVPLSTLNTGAGTDGTGYN